MNTDKSRKQPEGAAHIVSVESVRKHLVEAYELDLSETEVIIETYGEALHGYLQKLLQAVRNKNGEEGSAHAHGLKGACLNLGLPEQASRAELLEKELPRNNPEKYEKEVEHLIAALQAITKRA